MRTTNLVFANTVFTAQEYKENHWYFKQLDSYTNNGFTRFKLNNLHTQGTKLNYAIDYIDRVGSLLIFQESYSYPGLNFSFMRQIFVDTSSKKRLSDLTGKPEDIALYFYETGSLTSSVGFDENASILYIDNTPDEIILPLKRNNPKYFPEHDLLTLVINDFYADYVDPSISVRPFSWEEHKQNTNFALWYIPAPIVLPYMLFMPNGDIAKSTPLQKTSEHQVAESAVATHEKSDAASPETVIMENSHDTLRTVTRHKRSSSAPVILFSALHSQNQTRPQANVAIGMPAPEIMNEVRSEDVSGQHANVDERLTTNNQSRKKTKKKRKAKVSPKQIARLEESIQNVTLTKPQEIAQDIKPSASPVVKKQNATATNSPNKTSPRKAPAKSKIAGPKKNAQKKNNVGSQQDEDEFLNQVAAAAQAEVDAERKRLEQLNSALLAHAQEIESGNTSSIFDEYEKVFLSPLGLGFAVLSFAFLHGYRITMIKDPNAMGSEAGKLAGDAAANFLTYVFAATIAMQTGLLVRKGKTLVQNSLLFSRTVPQNKITTALDNTTQDSTMPQLTRLSIRQ